MEYIQRKADQSCYTAGLFSPLWSMYSINLLNQITLRLFFLNTVFFLSDKNLTIFNKKGVLTALTTFIIIVGLVYQFILRGIWEPKGMQYIADELLHTIIPLYTLVYWIVFSTKERIKFSDVAIGLYYPLVYLIFVLVRGRFYNYYPYPFLNIPEIGVGKVLINGILILLLILFIMAILVSIKHRGTKNIL